MTTNTKTQGCNACNKSSLSLLLLRPSPVPSDSELALPGSQHLQDPGALIQNIAPKRAQPQSKAVLRLLRPGFVHVYVPHPPAGVRWPSPPQDMPILHPAKGETGKWLHFRVSDSADLIPQNHPTFAQQPYPPRCSTDGHNKMGARLLTIPDAHLFVGASAEIWVAFSPNPWNATLRKQNRANPAAMQKVMLGGGLNAHSFVPTAQALKDKVLEFSCVPVKGPKVGYRAPVYPLNAMLDQHEAMAAEMAKACAKRPETAGKAVAVVVSDPVGFAAELNAARLQRHDIAVDAYKAKMALPDNAWAVSSYNAYLLLKKLVDDAAYAKALDKHAPLMKQRDFASMRGTSTFSPWRATEGAALTLQGEWIPLDEHSPKADLTGDVLGRVWHRRSLALAAEEGKSENDEVWADLADEFNEKRYAKWKDGIDAWYKQAHTDPLAICEQDWWLACTDASFRNVFALHFDANEAPSVSDSDFGGVRYAREAGQAMVPEPRTKGPALNGYLDQLMASPSEPTAILLRSLQANQQHFLDRLSASAIDQVHKNRSDKIFDFGAGMLLDERAGAVAASRFKWFNAVTGNALGGYALAALAALDAADALAAAAGVAAATALQRKIRLTNLQIVQQAKDLALQSILQSKVLDRPLVITKTYPVREGTLLLTRGGYCSRVQARKSASGATMEISLHTTTQEMQRFMGDMDTALYEGAGRVDVKGAAKPAAVLAAPTAAGAIVLDEVKFSQLYGATVSRASQTLGLTKRGIEKLSESTFGGVLGALEGRLAVGVILLNGKGVVDTLTSSAEKAKAAGEDWASLWRYLETDDFLGLVDGTSSIMAATTQMYEIGRKLVLERSLGAQVTETYLKHSAATYGLRVFSSLLGVFAGVAQGVLSLRKSADASAQGHLFISELYFYSGLTFFGTVAISLGQGIGAVGEGILAKTVKDGLLRTVGARLALIGRFTPPMAGLALLALAVAFEGAAIALTPSRVEDWIAKSKFGKKAKFANWEEESVALKALFEPPKN